MRPRPLDDVIESIVESLWFKVKLVFLSCFKPHRNLGCPEKKLRSILQQASSCTDNIYT